MVSLNGQQEVVITFGQSQKQGDQKCHNDDPWAYNHPGGLPACKNAKQKPDCDTEDIDNRYPLKPEGVVLLCHISINII